MQSDSDQLQVSLSLFFTPIFNTRGPSFGDLLYQTRMTDLWVFLVVALSSKPVASDGNCKLNGRQVGLDMSVNTPSWPKS